MKMTGAEIGGQVQCKTLCGCSDKEKDLFHFYEMGGKCEVFMLKGLALEAGQRLHNLQMYLHFL